MLTHRARESIAMGIALIWLALLGSACSDGIVISLGERDAAARSQRDAATLPSPQGPRRIAELSSSGKTDNPTLTGDLLEIYFTSDRSGGLGDVWMARRDSRDQSFGAPVAVSAVNTPGFETSSAISADGLTLWFSSDRQGGVGDLDIWVTQRSSRRSAWSAPTNVRALNTSAKDIPRPPGQHELVMPLASDLSTPGSYQMYLAQRSAPTAAFGPPRPVPELITKMETTVDGWLSDDGLSLLFSSGAAFAPTDLFLSRRASISDPFGARTPLTAVNTSNDERDPWLSPDGRELYFASDRGGHLEIYVTDFQSP
jgi:hypothetical protein